MPWQDLCHEDAKRVASLRLRQEGCHNGVKRVSRGCQVVGKKYYGRQDLYLDSDKRVS